MIFVVLGTQKFQMNRLLCAVDKLVGSGLIDDEVYAQIGNSDYIPSNYSFERFLDKNKFEEKIEKCDLLITHGGVSTIISGVQHNKPIIVVPRLEKYKEHVDNHQIQICKSFAKLNYVLICNEIDELSELINKSKKHSFSKYHSEREKMLSTIDDYLKTLL